MSVLATSLLFSSEDEFLVMGKLQWDSEDPLTLTLLFHAANGDIPWVFSRSLVGEAITDGAAGAGDVRIDIKAGRLGLILESPHGSASLAADAAEVVSFLEQTYAVVPHDAEDYEAELNLALSEWLEEG